MRDQPFKRYFPSEKKIPKNNYKYPTYQHYYDSKVLPLNPPSTKYQQKQNGINKLQDAFITPTKRGSQISQPQLKKDSKPNLKTELEHLKNQVYRIMQKKQGILRSPIVDKRTIIQKQNEMETGSVDDTDNQSVSSEKIFGETMRKVELKKMTQNYDYSKYMELQNNLLKTELRNLKNKYISKKKEITEKCEGLELKNQFLQNALFKSEQSLAEEITMLKANLKEAQNNEKQQIIPTSDKNQECSKLEQLYSIITKLQKEKQELQKKPIYNVSVQQVITNLKSNYEEKISNLLQQKNTLLLQIEQKGKLRRQLQKENDYLSSEISLLKRRIESQIQRQEQLQQQYNKTLEIAQKRHEELIGSLHKQFNSKLLSLTPKKQSQKSQPAKENVQISEACMLRKEIKRWKIEYKILKERFESYLKMQSQSQSEIKDYYKGYQEYRQKNEILQSKNKLLQEEFSKCIRLLSQKDSSLIGKEVELNNTKNDLQTHREDNEKQLVSLKDRCRTLQQRILEQAQRNEKDIAYRQQLQQKLLNSQAGDQKLKEALERTKKRLVQQDEKLSKNVKQLKNKESLISKLKKQLRELMQSTDKKRQQRMLEQANKIIEAHKNSEQNALVCLKQQFIQEKKLMDEGQSKLISQIEALKLQSREAKKKIVDVSNQLKLISHAYNTKTIQLSSVIVNRQQQIRALHQQLQEFSLTSESIQASLREQVNMKNEEIMYLRKEVVSKYSTTGALNISGSFDDVLRSQIEGNNKLKEQSLRKVQQIYKMRDNYSALRSQYENLKSENDINKLKFLSQKKNIEVAYEADIQNYKNSIDNWQKKIVSLQQKIKIFIEQNKKKDQFIQQFIIGKRITENQKEVLSDFMKQYQISIGSNDILERLMVETNTIQNLEKYNQSLLRELALLKEKLTLFQAMEEQRVSLYQSNRSPNSKKSIEQRIQQVVSESKLKKAISLQDLPNVQLQP